MMRFIALLVSLFVLTPSQTFAEVSAIVEDGKAVGLEAKDAEGNVQWTVRHRATEGIQELRGPLYLDGKWVYSIGGDVLMLSDDGKIIGRTQYPALISHLRVEDQKLWVTLKSEKGNLAEVPHSESHHAQRVWSNFHEVALRAFTDLPVEIRGDEVSQEEWEEALPDLIVIEETDLTNPISSAYLGLAYKALGQDALVVPAFERAIARSTTWSDDLKVCGVLERAGKAELAERACTQAVNHMRDSGIQPEELRNLVLVAITTMHLSGAMAEAVDAKDYERIDRIAGYYRAAYPNGDASGYAWQTLGVWLAEEGQHEQAKRWQAHAQSNINSAYNQLAQGQARTIDLQLLLVVSLVLALYIGAFAIGIRSQRRRPGGEGWRLLFCRPTLLETLSMLALLSLTTWALLEASRGVSQIGHAAEMPFTDTLGAPDVIEWLETFEDSPAKTELLTYATHELDAFKSGQEVTLERPSSTRVVDLVRERSKSDASFKPLHLLDLARAGKFGAHHAKDPGSIFLDLLFLTGLLFFMIFGRLASQVVPRKVLIGICAFVPGSLAAAAAPWVATAVIAAFFYIVTPFGSILHKIATPSFTRYYGLQAIEAYHVTKPDLILMVSFLVLGMLLHLVSVILYARSTTPRTKSHS